MSNFSSDTPRSKIIVHWKSGGLISRQEIFGIPPAEKCRYFMYHRYTTACDNKDHVWSIYRLQRIIKIIWSTWYPQNLMDKTVKMAAVRGMAFSRYFIYSWFSSKYGIICAHLGLVYMRGSLTLSVSFPWFGIISMMPFLFCCKEF